MDEAWYPFAKYQGLGNDFIILLDRTGDLELAPETVRRLCDRHFGIGADGVIRVVARGEGEPPVMDHRNADGSVAPMCGNGLRCVAIFVRERGLVTSESFTVQTASGPMRVTETVPGMVTAELGPPDLKPDRIPVLVDGPDALQVPVTVAGRELEFACIGIGATHAVTFVADPAAVPLEEIGPAVSALDLFPRGTNVSFVTLASPSHAHMRIWERGVGETYACGTGACAVAVAARLLHGAEESFEVTLPGGSLQIEWPLTSGRDAPIRMTGPAKLAYRGEVVLPIGHNKQNFDRPIEQLD